LIELQLVKFFLKIGRFILYKDNGQVKPMEEVIYLIKLGCPINIYGGDKTYGDKTYGG
jgi:hypothetical protein